MMKKNSKLITVFLIVVFLITSGLGCRCTPEKLAEKIKPVNLVYWRVDEGQDAFGGIINGFRSLYPHVSITYKLISANEYEQTLLEAWAEDRGPDIFSIPNTWVGKYQTKILPLNIPDEIEIGRQIMTGMIKKEPKIILEKIKTPSLRDLREDFVEAVPQDVVRNNQLFGLPLALDVLTMYYNRDLFNNASIITPPETWEDFGNAVRQLTLTDRHGNFIHSGAAIGGVNNISNLTDLVSLLMLQNGTQMINKGGQAIFNKSAPDDKGYFPGQEALRFYTDFATPNRDIYTWNNQMPNDLDAFLQGKTAILFGYSDYLDLIKERAPKLNFDIAKIPQIRASVKEVNYARYWMETVSKKTASPNEAWAFVLYSAQSQNAKTFVERAKKPTAHRDLISIQLEDFDMAPFADSVLTAQTWYHGKDYKMVEEAFRGMVNDVLTGAKDIRKSLDYCVQKVNLSY